LTNSSHLVSLVGDYAEIVQVKELGHLVLYVRDLDRSRRFYRDLLGWSEITVPGSELGFPAAAFSSGRTHHELLLIEVGESAAPIPRGRRVGMYHFGLKIGETDDELRQARDQLLAAGTPIAGTADHGVTHSLYIADPDGNEIELYIDVQPAVWKQDPAAIFALPRPLRL
jgi:catechol 2,3-dioxygenase